MKTTKCFNLVVSTFATCASLFSVGIAQADDFWSKSISAGKVTREQIKTMLKSEEVPSDIERKIRPATLIKLLGGNRGIRDGFLLQLDVLSLVAADKINSRKQFESEVEESVKYLKEEGRFDDFALNLVRGAFNRYDNLKDNNGSDLRGTYPIFLFDEDKKFVWAKDFKREYLDSSFGGYQTIKEAMAKLVGAAHWNEAFPFKSRTIGFFNSTSSVPTPAVKKERHETHYEVLSKLVDGAGIPDAPYTKYNDFAGWMKNSKEHSLKYAEDGIIVYDMRNPEANLNNLGDGFDPLSILHSGSWNNAYALTGFDREKAYLYKRFFEYGLKANQRDSMKYLGANGEGGDVLSHTYNNLHKLGKLDKFIVPFGNEDGDLSKIVDYIIKGRSADSNRINGDFLDAETRLGGSLYVHNFFDLKKGRYLRFLSDSQNVGVKLKSFGSDYHAKVSHLVEKFFEANKGADKRGKVSPDLRGEVPIVLNDSANTIERFLASAVTNKIWNSLGEDLQKKIILETNKVIDKKIQDSVKLKRGEVNLYVRGKDQESFRSKLMNVVNAPILPADIVGASEITKARDDEAEIILEERNKYNTSKIANLLLPLFYSKDEKSKMESLADLFDGENCATDLVCDRLSTKYFNENYQVASSEEEILKDPNMVRVIEGESIFDNDKDRKFADSFGKIINNYHDEKSIWGIYSLKSGTSGARISQLDWGIDVNDNFNDQSIKDMFLSGDKSSIMTSWLMLNLLEDPEEASKIVKTNKINVWAQATGDPNATGPTDEIKGKIKDKYFASLPRRGSSISKSYITNNSSDKLSLDVAALRYIDLVSDYIFREDKSSKSSISESISDIGLYLSSPFLDILKTFTLKRHDLEMSKEQLNDYLFKVNREFSDATLFELLGKKFFAGSFDGSKVKEFAREIVENYESFEDKEAFEKMYFDSKHSDAISIKERASDAISNRLKSPGIIIPKSDSIEDLFSNLRLLSKSNVSSNSLNSANIVNQNVRSVSGVNNTKGIVIEKKDDSGRTVGITFINDLLLGKSTDSKLIKSFEGLSDDLIKRIINDDAINSVSELLIKDGSNNENKCHLLNDLAKGECKIIIQDSSGSGSTTYSSHLPWNDQENVTGLMSEIISDLRLGNISPELAELTRAKMNTIVLDPNKGDESKSKDSIKDKAELAKIFQDPNMEDNRFQTVKNAFNKMFRSKSGTERVSDKYGDNLVTLIRRIDAQIQAQEQEALQSNVIAALPVVDSPVPVETLSTVRAEEVQPLQESQQNIEEIIKDADTNNTLGNIDSLGLLLRKTRNEKPTNYNVERMITELSADDWISIAKGEAGFDLKEKDTGNRELLFANEENFNIFDLQVGVNSADTLRKKMRYYAPDESYKANPKKLHEVSSYEFNKAVTNEMLTVKDKISDLSGFIQKNSTLRNNIRDMKVGLSPLLGGNGYQVIPMSEDPNSPYMVLLINELLENEEISKKIKVYDEVEFLSRLLDSISINGKSGYALQPSQDQENTPLEEAVLDNHEENSEDDILISKVVNNIISNNNKKNSLFEDADITSLDLRTVFKDSIIKNIAIDYRNGKFIYGDGSINTFSAKGKIVENKNEYVGSGNEPIVDGSKKPSEYFFATLAKHFSTVADNRPLVDRFESNLAVQESLKNIKPVVLDSGNDDADNTGIFDELKKFGSDKVLNKSISLFNTKSAKADSAKSALENKVKINLFRDIIRKKGIKPIAIDSSKKHIAMWADEILAKRYLDKNLRDLAKLMIKDSTVGMNNYRNVLEKVVFVSTPEQALDKVRSFIKSGNGWFNTDNSIFKDGNQGILISNKGLFDFLDPISVQDTDSESKKKNLKYEDFFTVSDLDMILLGTNGGNKFVLENGNSEEQLDEGRKKLVDIIEDENSGISKDEFESLILQNPRFIRKIIENDAKVKLENFVEAQKLDRYIISLDDITYNIAETEKLVGEDYAKLSIMYGLTETFKEYVNVEAFKTGSVKDNAGLMSHLDLLIGKDLYEHPIFNNSSGKRIILNSFDGGKINKIKKLILDDDISVSSYILPVKVDAGNLVVDIDQIDSFNNQVSVNQLFGQSNFINLNDQAKSKFIDYLVNQEIKNVGLYSNNITKDFRNIYLLNHILSKDISNSFYNKKGYNVDLGFRPEFNKDFNSNTGYLIGSYWGEKFGSSIGLRGLLSELSLDSYSSSKKGMSVDVDFRIFHSGSSFDGFVDSKVIYSIIGNSFDDRSNIKYPLSGYSITSGIGLNSSLGAVYNYSPKTNIMSYINLNLKKLSFSSNEYDLSEFNRNIADLSFNLSGKFIPSENVDVVVSGSAGRDLINSENLFDANLAIGYKMGNFAGSVGCGVSKYHENDVSYNFNLLFSYNI